MVAVVAIVVGQNFNAFCCNIDVFGGHHISYLLGIVATSLHIDVAAQAPNLGFNLFNLITVTIFSVFHPPSKVFGIGNYRSADAAGDLTFCLDLIVLAGTDIDIAAGRQGSIILRGNAATEDVDISFFRLQYGHTTSGQLCADSFIEIALCIATVIKRPCRNQFSVIYTEAAALTGTVLIGGVASNIQRYTFCCRKQDIAFGSQFCPFTSDTTAVGNNV